MTPLVHHITLTVRDASQSAAWYEALLGEASTVERQGAGWRRLRMSWSGGLVLGLTEFDERPSSQTFSHLNLGLDHIGLTCESAEAVRSWAAKMERLGIDHGPVEEAPYGWAVTARDPNNIPIEFFCAR